MNETIKLQIEEIRQSGKVNMLDIPAVQRLAFENNFFELVMFIEENRQSYANFFFTGKIPEK